MVVHPEAFLTKVWILFSVAAGARLSVVCISELEKSWANGSNCGEGVAAEIAALASAAVRVSQVKWNWARSTHQRSGAKAQLPLHHDFSGRRPAPGPLMVEFGVFCFQESDVAIKLRSYEPRQGCLSPAPCVPLFCAALHLGVVVVF